MPAISPCLGDGWFPNHRSTQGVAAAPTPLGLDGALTPEERAEYQLFVEVGDLVALLQTKARRYLAEHPAA
jgi:hypothetical protein